MMIGFNAPAGTDIIEDIERDPADQPDQLLRPDDAVHAGFPPLRPAGAGRFLLGRFPSAAHSIRRASLISLTDTLETTFYIMLRLASPFLLYGLMFKMSIGFINKLAPQIPIYFISTPYLLMGGLFMLYLGIAAMISQFADAFLGVFNGH